MMLLEKILGFYLFGLMRMFEVTPAWLETLRQRREAVIERMQARNEARRQGRKPGDLAIPKENRYAEISFRGRR